MKLSTVAVSVIAVVGVASVGGSWYTGKLAEEKYNEIIELANQNLKSLGMYGMEAQIKEVKFNRNFFSSDVKYELQVKSNGETNTFIGDDKIYHGPFPLNRLSKGNIVPVMMSAENKIAVPESLKPRFKNEQYAVTGQSNISYSGDVSGTVETKPFTSEDGTLDISATQSDYDYDKSGNGNVNAKIANVKMVDVTGAVIAAEDSEYNIDFLSNKEYAYLGEGTYSVKFKTFSFSDGSLSQESFIFNDLIAKGKNSINNGRYNSKGDFSAQLEMKSPTNVTKLGKLFMDMEMDVDAKITNDAMPYLSNENMYSAEADKAFISVFTNAVKFNIKELSLENAKGKNNVSLALNMDKFDPNKMANMTDFLGVFKQSALDIKLHLASLEELVKEANASQGMEKELAEQQAKLIVNELVNSAQSSGTALVDSESIKFNLSIDNGKVSLNGRDVPQEEVERELIMLMMGFGGL
ncbi:YdgA family protein [Glaesserella sp.]|uniref:YdgA family protein n=1 Tax=Glaesserella sp. TaxID=2094731 RepID=UPI00359F1FA0